jgi:hypothetical protein
MNDILGKIGTIKQNASEIIKYLAKTQNESLALEMGQTVYVPLEELEKLVKKHKEIH